MQEYTSPVSDPGQNAHTLSYVPTHADACIALLSMYALSCKAFNTCRYRHSRQTSRHIQIHPHFSGLHKHTCRNTRSSLYKQAHRDTRSVFQDAQAFADAQKKIWESQYEWREVSSRLWSWISTMVSTCWHLDHRRMHTRWIWEGLHKP